MIYDTKTLLGSRKGKVYHIPLESIGACSSPSPRPWICRWRITNVHDAWPLQRQTYDYLPSHNALLTISSCTAWWQRIMWIQYVYHIWGLPVREPSLSITNKQIHSLTYKH